MIDRYVGYLAAIRRYSPRTCELYRSVLEEFRAFAAESAGESETAGADIAAYLDIRTIRSYEVHLLDGKKESAKTVNLHLSVLSGFCKFLMKEGILAGNPVRLVARPRQEKRRSQQKARNF